MHPRPCVHVLWRMQECAHTSGVPTPMLGACILGNRSPYLLYPAMINYLQLLATSHEHLMSATACNHPVRRRCSEEVNKRAWILHCCYFYEQDWRRQLREARHLP